MAARNHTRPCQGFCNAVVSTLSTTAVHPMHRLHIHVVYIAYRCGLHSETKVPVSTASSAWVCSIQAQGNH